MLVYHLPADSATARVLGLASDGWDLEAYLIADVFHALSGKPHPSRPQPKTGGNGRHAQLLAKLRAQRERLGTDSPPPPSPAV